MTDKRKKPTLADLLRLKKAGCSASRIADLYGLLPSVVEAVLRQAKGIKPLDPKARWR